MGRTAPWILLQAVIAKPRIRDVETLSPWIETLHLDGEKPRDAKVEK
jgi:hypothetical protein